jgi:Ser/Thr protein kinase RdoA (MazF antagonist)
VKDDLFFSLTPERVLDAVEAAGLATNPVCYPLNSFENRVYEVELADKTRIIAKFYRPGRWSEEQIREEHAFVEELDGEEVPVTPVRRFPDGSTVKRQGHILYSLAERRGGRAPDELSDELVVRLGMLVGRLHAVGARADAPHRLRLTPDVFVRANLAWLGDHGTIPERLAGRYVAAAGEIADRTDALLADLAAPVHRLHGDLHLGNLLERDGVLHLLDFDDMVVGPAVQDLWLPLPGRDTWALRQRELFLEGYERFRAFDRASLVLVEPLRALRMVHFATWLARRWHDPIFPVTWPQFGTDAWWQQEVEDLEDQLRRIRRQADPVAAAAAADEEELTNADLFWDWEEPA